MPKTALKFRRTELRRAIRAVRETGLPVSRVLIYPAEGKFEIQTGAAQDSSLGGLLPNEWDE